MTQIQLYPELYMARAILVSFVFGFFCIMEYLYFVKDSMAYDGFSFPVCCHFSFYILTYFSHLFLNFHETSYCWAKPHSSSKPYAGLIKNLQICKMESYYLPKSKSSSFGWKFKKLTRRSPHEYNAPNRSQLIILDEN